MQKATKCAFDSFLKNDGGDDRIRTCGSLLDYNDLANRRFQPLSHVSVSARIMSREQTSILADKQTLSSNLHLTSSNTFLYALDTTCFCEQNTGITGNAV